MKTERNFTDAAEKYQIIIEEAPVLPHFANLKNLTFGTMTTKDNLRVSFESPSS